MAERSIGAFRTVTPRALGYGRILAAGLVAAAVLGIAGLVYLLGFSTITIVDGGQAREVRTRQRDAAAVLREAGITVYPEDIVSPGLGEPISGNAIMLRRASLVRLQVDDSAPLTLRTQARTAGDLLQALGQRPRPFDRVLVNGQPGDAIPQVATTQGMANVELRRATEFSLAEKGKPPVAARTTGRTVGEALAENNVTIYLADKVSPALTERLEPGTQINIERARVVDVIVDGRRVRTRTHSARVGDVLTELNIILYDQDFTQPALNTQVNDQLQVQVVRVRRDVEIAQSPIPFESLVQADAEIEIDQFVLKQEGAPGVRERRMQVTYENGAEVKRELIADFVAKGVQNKINAYGTKVVVRTLDTPAGPLSYWRKIRMSATSYSPSTAGVSKSAKNFGITRCGIPMTKGIVAVDPNYIPLRTNVYVPGYGQGLACDTGGAIKGKRIDLGFDDENLELIYRPVDVYILTPVPPRIKYQLN